MLYHFNSLQKCTVEAKPYIDLGVSAIFLCLTSGAASDSKQPLTIKELLELTANTTAVTVTFSNVFSECLKISDCMLQTN